MSTGKTAVLPSKDLLGLQLPGPTGVPTVLKKRLCSGPQHPYLSRQARQELEGVPGPDLDSPLAAVWPWGNHHHYELSLPSCNGDS